MATNERIRQRFQAGLETVRGTAVPATRIVFADISPSYDRAIQDFPDRSGTYFSRRRVSYMRPVIGFSGTDLLTYEDLPWWMLLGISKDIAAVGDAGAPEAFTRTFTPHATLDNLASMTLEFNESGNPYESDQVMLNQWTIRIDPDNDGAWMFDFTALGRNWASTAYTAALPDRTTEVIRAAGTKAYLDDVTLGTTQVVGKVIAATITCNLNLHMKAFLEDDQDWSPNKVGRDARTFDATVTMEFDSDVEFAKYRSSTAVERHLRLRREGSIIHGAIRKAAEVNLHGYWRSIGFGDREGNLTATFGLQGFYNSVDAYDAQVISVNALDDPLD